MNTERIIIEKRIVEILRYIAFPEVEKFIKSLSLYKDEELKQVVSYLETGNLEWMYHFLLETKKELLEIHEEKWQLQSKRKLQKLKNEERKEQEEELIQINF